MATRTITVKDASLITALGGTVNANDSVYINAYAIDFSAADLSAADLARLELTPGYSGRLSAATGAALKAVVNQTGSGILINRSNSPDLEIKSSGPTGVIATIVNQPAFGGAKVSIDDCKPTAIYHDSPSALMLGATCDLSAATLVATRGRVYLRQTASASTYPADVIHVGGDAEVECERDIDEAFVGGGGVLRAAGPHCSPTAVTMQGGRFDMGLVSAVGTLQGNSGVVDQRNLTTPITIATMTLGPGVEIWRSPQTVVPTVTSDTSPAGGPRIRMFGS